MTTEKSRFCEEELALEEHIHENLNAIVHHKQYIEGVFATTKTKLSERVAHAKSLCNSEIAQLRASAKLGV